MAKKRKYEDFENFENFEESEVYDESMDDIVDARPTKKLVNPGATLNWLEKLLNIIDRYGIVKILRALVLLIIIVVSMYVVFNPEKVIQIYVDYQEQLDKKKTEEHNDLIKLRLENTPKIQNECDRLLLRADAQRVLFFELHNNTGNINGLPFYFADASCESMDDVTRPIAEHCREIKLSLMPFATELFKSHCWHGDMDQLKTIDKALYYKLMAVDTGYLLAIVVEGPDEPCGMMFIMYDAEHVPNYTEILHLAQQSSLKIALYIQAIKSAQ